MNVFEIQALLVLILYGLMILSFYAGWQKTESLSLTPQEPSVKVSVLIAVRNEAANLHGIFGALERQDYPDSLWEVVFVDDHSDDRSAELLLEFCHRHENARLIRLDGISGGKKLALEAGQRVVTGDLILMTDADCIPASTWITSMAGFFKLTSAGLILGPVDLAPSVTLTEKLQRTEFISLMAASAGSCGLGHPIMAHGPNMAVPTRIYREFAGDLNARFSSGDDVFFLGRLKGDSNNIVRFNRSRDALVSTRPAKSLLGFFSQRRRWASKARGYKDPAMVAATLLVFITSVQLLTTAVLAIFGAGQWGFLLLLMTIKLLSDLPLLSAALAFYRFGAGLAFIMPLQVLYPIYVSITGLIALTGKFEWKGRRVG